MAPHDLKAIRAQLKLRQGDLAELIGVARNTVTRWEMGLRHVPEPVARLVRMLRAVRGARGYLEGEAKHRIGHPSVESAVVGRRGRAGRVAGAASPPRGHERARLWGY